MQHLKWALMLKKEPVHCCASCIGSLIYFGYFPTKKKAKTTANKTEKTVKEIKRCMAEVNCRSRMHTWKFSVGGLRT